MAETATFRGKGLSREITLRGLTPEALAREAGLSIPTVYKAIKGLPIKHRSMTSILIVLGRVPVIDGADDLVKSA